MPSQASASLHDFCAAHTALLTWLHAQSNAGRWNVSRDEFSCALYCSAEHHFVDGIPSGEGLEIFLRGLHLEDLALACALRLGYEPAWEEFVARYRPLLYAAARAIVASAGEARARELADSLYADLYGVKTPDGETRRPLLDYFHGRSKLATWLRAVLAQRHVDFLRAARRTTPLAEEPSLGIAADGDAHPLRDATRAAGLARTEGARPDGAGDPDRRRLLPRLQHAVSQALAALAPDDRLLLSLYYLEGLTLAQIARLRGVHEATVSRHLARIARDLREAVERALLNPSPAQNGAGAQGPLSLAQVELCFAYAQEDWPLDLRRELSGQPGKTGGPPR
jgi:RNA polymerase sigma factor (sigma-70 family)